MSNEATAWQDTGCDAEIQRDAALRARPREARHASGPTWKTPEVVAMAKCKAHAAGCTNLVSVTSEGMDALEGASRMLTKRGERPLDLNDCFVCESCRATWASVETEKAATRRTKTTEAIRYCKQASEHDMTDAWVHVKAGGAADKMHPTTPDAVVEAAKRLQFLRRWQGEGYVTDLLTAIREKRGGKGKRKEDL
jgi:hypothetical protein